MTDLERELLDALAVAQSAMNTAKRQLRTFVSGYSLRDGDRAIDGIHALENALDITSPLLSKIKDNLK